MVKGISTITLVREETEIQRDFRTPTGHVANWGLKHFHNIGFLRSRPELFLLQNSFWSSMQEDQALLTFWAFQFFILQDSPPIWLDI